MIGTWAGPGTEGSRITYSMEMKIERLEAGEYAGRTTYSAGLNCGALNTFREKRGETYVFEERINSGRGCANGRVEISETDDQKLSWEWFRSANGGRPAATAILERRH